MEPDTILPLSVLLHTGIEFTPPGPFTISWMVFLTILLLFSAMISGSEVAFFSLSPSDLDKLGRKNTTSAAKTLQLIKMPEQLLGTILVANNFVNVAIVIISSFISNSMLDFGDAQTLGFLFQVVLITFLLLLFGEILPKIYANENALGFALKMSISISVLRNIFRPVIYLLISSTNFVNRRLAVKKKQNISMDELQDALSLAETEIKEDKQILEGIVKFSNIDSGEILRSRVDIFAVDISTPFPELLKEILESGYSRIPVYTGSFDNINGILYIKDLFPHLNKGDRFKWQSLIRPAYFVPETKKINDLLEEFQLKKIHLAFVIDEYGGTSGIVTLEDILEEIVGEIKDEFEEEDSFYTRLGESTWKFEGKTLLNDFYKVTDCDEEIFDNLKGDADTLAGLVLEQTGEMPNQGESLDIEGFRFGIISVDKRRIKEIKISRIEKNKK